MEAASAPRPHGLRVPKPRRLLAALSDERLVEHVRRGESAAFEVLYDRHTAGILGFCRHMLGSAADAEDAVQHTFIAAHADILRSGDRQLYVKAWLYTIARNRCLSMLRARREQPADGEIEIVTDRLDHDLAQRDDLRALLADVSRLPEDQREALVLAEVGGLAHEDIGAVIGCEANKVKSLVFQARSNLIDRRIARETPCEQIREEIATLRGGALRRSYLRHHLEACPGCTEYREEIRRQRAMLALALPVVPSLALRTNVLGSVGIGGGSAAAAGGTAATATTVGLAHASAVKIAIAAVLLVSAGGAAVKNGGVPLLHHSSPSSPTEGVKGEASSSGGSGASHKNGTAAAATAAASKQKSTGSHRSASGTAHGFTPVTGESNGARAREFAATRGKGKHTGISKQHSHSRTHTKKTHVKKLHVRHVAAPPVKVAPKAHTQPSGPAPTKPQSTPKSQPAPQSSQPAPQTQSTTPPPTPTTTTPIPGNGDGNGIGKTPNNGKRVATDVTG